MSAVGLLPQNVRALEIVARPRVPTEFEALAVTASSVAACAADEGVQVNPGRLIRTPTSCPDRTASFDDGPRTETVAWDKRSGLTPSVKFAV
jgi:hypothetical protein